MRYIFLLGIMAYLAGNIYLFARLIGAMVAMPVWCKVLFGALYWLCCAALPATLLLRDVALPHIVMQALHLVGSTWLILSLYTLCILGILELIHLVVPGMEHRLATAFGITLALLVYGYWSNRDIHVEHIDISIDKPLDHPIRIAYISDVHLGYGTGIEQLRHYVEQINALHPDLLLIGGDLIDNSLRPIVEKRMAEPLAHLTAPCGIYAVVGNHEYICGIDAVAEWMRTTPVTLLRDSIVTLPNGIQIIGRDDRTNSHRKSLTTLVGACDSTRPIVMIDHQPFNLTESDGAGIDLHLGGHTHNGQVFPLNLLVRAMYEQPHGYRKWSHAHIFISSGISLWGPPFRIATHSDMALITLRGTTSTKE